MNPHRLALFVLTFLAAALSTVANATTWTVQANGSGVVPTIQAAIDTATDGDIILLEPGTYTGPGNRDVDYHGKNVHVTSSGGPSVTVIDVESLGYGFILTNDEGPGAMISGLTITRGYSAIYIEGASPTVAGNVIEHNLGSGISAEGSVTIIDNLIRNNGPADPKSLMGGGAQVYGIYAVVRGNTFLENSAHAGGGLYVIRAGTVENNTFERNSAAIGGGLVLNHWTLFESNMVKDNSATWLGGGCACGWSGNPAPRQCLLEQLCSDGRRCCLCGNVFSAHRPKYILWERRPGRRGHILCGHRRGPLNRSQHFCAEFSRIHYGLPRGSQPCFPVQ